VAIVLLILGIVLVPLALAGIWVRVVLFDTDDYVETMTRLITRPPIQEAVAEQLSVRLMEEFPVESQMLELWPDTSMERIADFRALIGHYTSVLSLQLVRSKAFVPMWSEANRELHESVVNVLDGDGPVKLSTRGDIAVDLSEISAELNRLFDEANVALPEPLVPTFGKGDVGILDPAPLVSLQPLVGTLSSLSIVFTVFAVIFLVGSVLLSRRRLLWIALMGAGTIVTMVLLQVGMLAFRGRFDVAAAEARVPDVLADPLWTSMVHSLDVATRVTLLAGLGLVVFAVVALFWRSRY